MLLGIFCHFAVFIRGMILGKSFSKAVQCTLRGSSGEVGKSLRLTAMLKMM